MEILDHEEKEVSNSKGKILGIFGCICQIIGTVSCLSSWYLHQVSSSDSSDMILINAGIQMSAIGKLIFLPVGIFCQRKAFSDFKFSPKWLWYILLICGLIVTLSSIKPQGLFFLFLGVMILKHVLTEKEPYFLTK